MEKVLRKSHSTLWLQKKKQDNTSIVDIQNTSMLWDTLTQVNRL